MKIDFDFLRIKIGCILINYKMKRGKMAETIKKLIKNIYNKIINSKISILIYGFLLGLLVVFILNIFQQNINITKRTKLFEQIDYFYQTWLDYQEFTGKELHDLWNDKFHDVEYRLDGNPKNNEQDCSSAIYWFLKDLNANFAFCKVQVLYDRLNIIAKKRASIKEVISGDLIIMYVDSNWHIGLVEGTRKNKNLVKYMDVNILSDGAGYKQITLNSYMVKGIYPVTFELWIDDLLRNVKRTKDIHIIVESEKIKEIKEVPKINKKETLVSEEIKK